MTVKLRKRNENYIVEEINLLKIKSLGSLLQQDMKILS